MFWFAFPMKARGVKSKGSKCNWMFIWMPRKCIFLNVLLTKNSGTYTVLFCSKALKPLSTTSVVQLFLQLLIRCLLSALWQSSTHSDSDGWTQSNLGFGILPRGTLTCRLEEVGIEPPTFGLFKNPTTRSQTRATRSHFYTDDRMDGIEFFHYFRSLQWHPHACDSRKKQKIQKENKRFLLPWLAMSLKYNNIIRKVAIK